MEKGTLALIFSFIAMSLVAASYFTQKKSFYLLFQSLGIVFLIFSYFCTQQFFAMIGLSIALLRALVFFAYEKKERQAPLSVSCLLAALTLFAYLIVDIWALKSAKYADLLLLSALVLYAFIFRIRDLRKVRIFMLVPTVLSILFNTLTGAALFASLTYVLELTADVVSIYKYHILEPQHSKKEYL